MTPSVDAWARCAVPKASLTKISALPASALAKSGSLAFSLASKRVFSRRTACPGWSCARSAVALSPMVSSANATVAPRSSVRRAATGRSEYFSSGLSAGRPMCEQRTSLAPFSRRCLMDGSAAWMRVSSVISSESLYGTLKSQRMRTSLSDT